MKKNKQIEKIIEEFLWQKNDSETRNLIKEKIEEIYKYSFTDETTPKLCMSGFVVFKGFNPKTKKFTYITIEPIII